MSRSQANVFVLWGDNFDEVAATVFVVKLREAGLRVKIVGLTPRRFSGAYGLTLEPDLTLDQALALAAQTICLIIPQEAQTIQHQNNDPRLRQLFELVAKNRGRFVIRSLGGMDIGKSELFPNAMTEKALVYPKDEEVMKFACQLAMLLLEM